MCQTAHPKVCIDRKSNMQRGIVVIAADRAFVILTCLERKKTKILSNVHVCEDLMLRQGSPRHGKSESCRHCLAGGTACEGTQEGQLHDTHAEAYHSCRTRVLTVHPTVALPLKLLSCTSEAT